MKRLTSILLIITTILLSLSGCDLIFGGGNDITPEEVKQMIDDGEIFVLLDIRSELEYDRGHIEGAINIPEGKLKAEAERIIMSKNTLIVVYCKNGTRTARAARTLKSLGYTNVKSMGGISDWTYGTVKN